MKTGYQSSRFAHQVKKRFYFAPLKCRFSVFCFCEELISQTGFSSKFRLRDSHASTQAKSLTYACTHQTSITDRAKTSCPMNSTFFLCEIAKKKEDTLKSYQEAMVVLILSVYKLPLSLNQCISISLGTTTSLGT